MSRHDTKSTDPTADGDVYKHVLVTILRCNPYRSNGRANYDEAGIGEEAWCYKVFLHLLNIANGRGVGSVHHNNNRADNAEETSDFSDHAQTFFEEDGRKNSCNDDGQSAQRCDEDGIGEGVCDKVEDLANDHESHASPPVKVLEVPVPFSSNFIVFFVGAQEADLFEDEGDADEDTRANGQTNTDRFIEARPITGVAANSAASREDIGVHGDLEDLEGFEKRRGESR